MQQERSSLQEYEKSYHKKHADLVNDVKRAEKDVKKAGKKSPQDLQSVSNYAVMWFWLLVLIG